MLVNNLSIFYSTAVNLFLMNLEFAKQIWPISFPNFSHNHSFIVSQQFVQHINAAGAGHIYT